MNWKYLQQPTSILGLAGIATSAVGIGAHFAGAHSWIAACVAIGAGAVTHLLIPDNSDKQNAIETVVADVVREVIRQRVEAELPDAMVLAKQVVGDLPKAAAVVISQPPKPAAPAGGGVATFPGPVAPRAVPSTGSTPPANQGPGGSADKAAAAKPLDLGPFAVKNG